MRVFGFVDGRTFYGGGGGGGGGGAGGIRGGSFTTPINSVRPFQRPAAVPPKGSPRPFLPSWELVLARAKAAALAGLAQIWAFLNPSRQLKLADNWGQLTNEEVTWATAATIAVDFTQVNAWSYNRWHPGIGTVYAARSDTVTGTMTQANATGFRWKLQAGGPPYGPHPVGKGSPPLGLLAEFRVNGVWVEKVIGVYGGGGWPSDAIGTVGLGTFSAFATALRRDGVAQPPPKIRVANPAEVVPDIEISTAHVPALIPLRPVKTTPAAPAGDPITQPEPAGDPVAPAPGTIAPPLIAVAAPALPKPAPTPDTPTTPAGSVIPWPGAQPVGLPGQAPQPTLEGIAQEVGKIERKMEIAFSPPTDKPGSNMSWDDWWDAINRIRQLLAAQDDKSGYEISSGCLPDDEPGGRNKPLRREWDGSWAFDGMIINRLDAIAGLLQDSKDLKQPICAEPPLAPVGRNISIQFRSDGPSPYGEKRLRKQFRYRDPSLKDLAEHVEHWKDFEWESGPWMVISEGLPWGKPQVWAKSEAEGRRVLTHAAQIAGVDLTSRSHRWRVHEAVGYRERPVMRMKVHRDVNGRLWIAERTSSAGPPMVLAQGSPLPGVGH